MTMICYDAVDKESMEKLNRYLANSLVLGGIDVKNEEL